MEAQQKPEGLRKPQAGVSPLQKWMVMLAPTGRQCTLSPLRGWGISILLLLLLSFFLSVSATAQTFTQRIQTVNGREAKMTVTHSKSIDDLVNGPNAQPVATPAKSEETKKPTEVKPTVTTATGRSTEERRITPGNTPAQPAATRPTTVGGSEPVRDTVDIILNDQPRKKVMRNSYKINGYRVQAFAGGNQRKDKQKAEQVGNDIKQHFPDEPVYTHFYSPRWICRVGNYRTYEEAHEMLVNIRKLGYTSATIVKGKITVQY